MTEQNPMQAEIPLSLGIVQSSPTQFDDPLYVYLAEKTTVPITVYYYAIGKQITVSDPEIGRKVGWNSVAGTGYSAMFCPEIKPFAFARQVLRGNHALILISGFTQPHALCTAVMANLKGVPVGLRLDSILPTNGVRLRHETIKRVLYPLLFKLYSTGHPVGRQAGEYLVSFGFRRESLFCVPYGVNHQWFAQESARAREGLGELRRSWGLPVEAQVVCGVVKFTEREDPLTLIRGFREARKQVPNLALLLIGDGPLRKDVEELADQELGRSIILPGYQDYSALPRAYAASDLFVHPASGPWEVSVNEALACGLPVITSDAVGSAYELILPNQVGYTYQHGNAGDLARRIVAVLRDESMLQRAREDGLNFLETWDYPATAARLADAIRFAAYK